MSIMLGTPMASRSTASFRIFQPGCSYVCIQREGVTR